MEQQPPTSRSFADRCTICRGAIATQWNRIATPTVHVIDASGVFRHEWLGESNGAAVDAAVHAWIAAAKKR